MTDESPSLITEFEAKCVRAGLAPTAVLKGAGIHPTLWKRWRDGVVSPTLRNFEAASRHLESLLAEAGGGLEHSGPSGADGAALSARNIADPSATSTVEKSGEDQ